MNETGISRSLAHQTRISASARNPRSEKDISTIIKFLKASASWPVWQRLTKESRYLLETLTTYFNLIEYPADIVLQDQEIQLTNKQVLLIVKGQIEVFFEKQDAIEQDLKSNSDLTTSAVALPLNKSEPESEIQLETLKAKSDESDSYDEDAEECEEEEYDEFIDSDTRIGISSSSPRSYQSSNNKNNRLSRKERENKLYMQSKSNTKKLLNSTKGKQFAQFSASDLDFYEDIIGKNHKRCKTKFQFLTQLKSYRKQYQQKKHFQKPKQHQSAFLKRQYHSFEKLPNITPNKEITKNEDKLRLSTIFQAGQVLNNCLLTNERASLAFSYRCLDDVSLLVIEKDRIPSYLSKRSKYIQAYESFLAETLNACVTLKRSELEYLRKSSIIKDNLKIDKVVFEQGQAPVNPSKTTIYLIKEGFFELQTGNPVQQQQQQPSSNFVSMSQHQLEAVKQMKSNQSISQSNIPPPTRQLETKAILQKGQFFGEEVLFSNGKPIIYQYTIKQRTPYSEIIEFKMDPMTMKYQFPPQLLEYFRKTLSEKKSTAFGDSSYEFSPDSNLNKLIKPSFDFPREQLSLSQIDQSFQLNQSKSNNKPNLKLVLLNDQVTLKDSFFRHEQSNSFLENSRQIQSAKNSTIPSFAKPPPQIASQPDRLQSANATTTSVNLTRSDYLSNSLSQPVVPNNSRQNQFVKKKNPKNFQSLSPNELLSSNSSPETINQKFASTSLHAFHEPTHSSSNKSKFQSASEKEIAVRTIRFPFDSLESKSTTLEQFSSPDQQPLFHTQSTQFQRTTSSIKPLPTKTALMNEINNRRNRIGGGEFVATPSPQQHQQQQQPKISKQLPQSDSLIQLAQSPKNYNNKTAMSATSKNFLNYKDKLYTSTSSKSPEAILNELLSSRGKTSMKLNSNSNIQPRYESTSESEVVRSFSLKGGKIKRMPASLKEQSDHSKQTSALIKIMYEIEHQKWLKSQQQQQLPSKPSSAPSNNIVKPRHDDNYSYSTNNQPPTRIPTQIQPNYMHHLPSGNLSNGKISPHSATSTPRRQLLSTKVSSSERIPLQKEMKPTRNSSSNDLYKAKVRRVPVTSEQYVSQSRTIRTLKTSGSPPTPRLAATSNKSLDSVLSPKRGRSGNENNKKSNILNNNNAVNSKVDSSSSNASSQLYSKHDSQSTQLTATTSTSNSSTLTVKKQRKPELDRSFEEQKQTVLKRPSTQGATPISMNSQQSSSKSPPIRKTLSDSQRQPSPARPKGSPVTQSSPKSSPRDHSQKPSSEEEKEPRTLSKYMANLQLETIVEKRRGQKNKNKIGEDGSPAPLDPEQALLEQNKLKAAAIKRIYQPTSANSNKPIKRATAQSSPSSRQSITESGNNNTQETLLRTTTTTANTTLKEKKQLDSSSKSPPTSRQTMDSNKIPTTVILTAISKKSSNSTPSKRIKAPPQLKSIK